MKVVEQIVKRTYADNGYWLPPSEVQPLVRCKDCQFYNEGRNEVDAWMRCRLHSMNTSPDEFCSWAVKKN